MTQESNLETKLNSVSSDLLLAEGPEDEVFLDALEDFQEFYQRIGVLSGLEDSDLLNSIEEQAASILEQLEQASEPSEQDFDELLDEITKALDDLSRDVQEYSTGIEDDATDQDSTDETEGQGSESQDSSQEEDPKDGPAPREEDSGDEDEPPDGPSQTEPGSYDEELFFDFYSEASDHLTNFEDVLLAVENDPKDFEIINEGFRAMHSIKGMAGFLNLTYVNKLSHAMENLLDLARDGYLLDDKAVDLLFDCLDCLKSLVSSHHETIDSGEAQNLRGDEFGRLYDELQEALERIEQQEPEAEVELDEDEGSDDDSSGSSGASLDDTGEIKVDTDKIDELVNAAGELVTTFNQLKQREFETSNGTTGGGLVSQMDRIVSELQEASLSLRMVPLKSTFNRMRRMVRDLANEFGKEVDLTISGAETELDRTLVDKIQDPLVHIIRNALDHGVESPEEREEKGKDPTGSIEISAYHQSGDVIIEVSDDGAGIDPDEVRERAIEKEVIDEDAELSDQEIYHLIFEPGFSTTEEVTDVSGRGVGMDVVKRNIHSVRGSIDIDSEIDKGSTFRLKIPLTLSIIGGMVVRVADQRFVIPTVDIVRSLRPDEDQITRLDSRGEMINIHGELVRVIHLRQLFDLSDEAIPLDESLVVVVESSDGKVALLVDALLGQQEVVIKSLGTAFDALQGISGASILGDGGIGLIIDPQTITDLADDANSSEQELNPTAQASS